MRIGGGHARVHIHPNFQDVGYAMGYPLLPSNTLIPTLSKMRKGARMQAVLRILSAFTLAWFLTVWLLSSLLQKADEG
jgi:hypothetical protein